MPRQRGCQKSVGKTQLRQGGDAGIRRGWLESARDGQLAVFRPTPSSTPSRPPLLIRGGEFKSPGFKGPEYLHSDKRELHKEATGGRN